MGTRRTERLWLIGGLFGIAVIVAAAYLLAIKPVYTKKDEHRKSAGDSQVTLVGLKRDLAKLENNYKNRAAHTAAMTAMQGHLPDNYDIPNLVRALHVSDKATGTVVSAIGVGAPTKVTTLPTVVSVPITLTVTGAPANIGKFLDRLQTIQPRAVLINSISIDQGDAAGRESLTMLLEAFCTKGTACTAQS